jgi:hypothetical protein
VFFLLPVVIGLALLLRARRGHATRMWADLAAFLLGAAALALVYAIPAAVNPMCMGAASGGCSSSGACGSTGPTDCTINYYAVAIAALYSACLVTGAVLAARVLRRSGPPPAFAGGSAS